MPVSGFASDAMTLTHAVNFVLSKPKIIRVVPRVQRHGPRMFPARLFAARSRALRQQGAREGALGLVLQARLVAAEKDRADAEGRQGRDQQRRAGGPAQAVDAVAEEISAEAVKAGPGDPPGRIGD